MEKRNAINYEPIRVAIQRSFIERTKKNSAYSLRAYANFLEIDQSHLSKILKGQRPVTAEIAQSVSPKLGISLAQLKELFASAATNMPGFLPLNNDEFEILAEWQHFAILELAKTKGFDAKPSAIAARLGLHVEEVRDALQRLVRTGLISINKDAIKLLSPNNSWSQSKQTTAARKKLQRTLLEKSIEALDHLPFDDRENGSVTIAIDRDRLPEFKEKLKQVRRELADYFQPEKTKNLNEVYQLTTSFYPLTKLNKKTGELK